MAAKIGICCQSLASRARPLAHCIIPFRGGKAPCLETHTRTKKKGFENGNKSNEEVGGARENITTVM